MSQMTSDSNHVTPVVCDSSRKANVIEEKERRRLLEDFSGADRAFDKDLLVHRLVEELSARSPNSIALKFGDRELKYDELNAQANKLANCLIKRGATVDGRIAVCMERSIDMIVALLAVLKSGAAYVPLDPSYPAQRLSYMLDDCRAAVLVNHSATRNLLSADNEIDIDRDIAILEAESEHEPPQHAGGQNARSLAYVMYTSGSTGRPKGVMIQHDSLVNRLLWAKETFEVTSADRVLQKTPFGFDVSVWEIFLPLLAGATLVIAEPGGHQDPFYLARVIDDERITLVHFVPSMLQIYLEAVSSRRHRTLRHVLCSGEALPRSLERKFRSEFPDLELHNLYGPTEAAIDVTHWPCRESTDESGPPIGRPVANTKIYILDERRELVPIGAVGELYIAGIQVARGYFGRDDLTAERFVANPFFADGDGDGMARMYRTGDLARYREDGALYYCGRNDFQIKLRGYRVELEEIERALTDIEEVVHAAVVPREDREGDKILVAYIQASAKTADNQLSVAAIKRSLAQTLPLYMIPPHIIWVDAFPVTANGKLDRDALPCPSGLTLVSRG